MKHHDLIIPSEAGTDPFENCRLGRKPYADVLTQIVSSYSDGFVLAINNEWGAGKSTFLKMWRQALINKGFKTLFYNAWENDFEKDVLVALISELKELKSSGSVELYNNVLKKAALLSKKVGAGVLKASIKRYIGVDSEELEKVLEGAAEIGFDSLEAEILAHQKRKDSLQGFREALEEFVHKADPENPIVFFIDELDRCRPNYAVEVLEQVKHLFSVPGIVFVLSIDKEQLGHAVKGVYGSEGINAEEYLRRFIDLEYAMPKPSMKKICEYLYSYYGFQEFLESKERLKYQDFQSDKDHLVKFATNLFSSEKLNFRQAEKIFALARVGLKSFKINNFVFPELYIFLAFLKNQNYRLFEHIREKKFSVNELIAKTDDIFLSFPKDDDIKRLCLIVTVELAFGYNNYYFTDEEGKPIYPSYGLTVGPTENSEENILLQTALVNSSDGEKLQRYYERLRYQGTTNFNLNHLLTKIQLLEPITE